MVSMFIIDNVGCPIWDTNSTCTYRTLAIYINSATITSMGTLCRMSDSWLASVEQIFEN